MTRQLIGSEPREGIVSPSRFRTPPSFATVAAAALGILILTGTAWSQRTWQRYADSAESAVLSGDIDGAIRYYSAAIENHPNTAALDEGGYSRDFLFSEDLAELHKHRGMLYLEIGNLTDGRLDMTVSLYFDPLEPDTWILRAETWIVGGMPGSAIDDLTEAIQLDDTDPYPFMLRGKTRLLLDEPQQAVEDLTAAIDTGGDDPEIRRLRAEAFRQLDRKSEAETDERVAAELERTATPAGDPD